MQIQENVSLLDYNTFHVDVKARFFVDIKEEEEVLDLISQDVWATQPRLILGGGANILFTKDYPGLVIKISLKGRDIVGTYNDTVYVKVGAGENRHETMMRSLAIGYAGGENVVLIPGQVGSAPVGNIGAYGKEAKDIIYQVEGIDLITKEKKVLSNEDCHFAYRDSIFRHDLKDRFLITAVVFAFKQPDAEYVPNIQYNDIQDAVAEQGKDPVAITPQEVADIIISIREKKLPDRTKIGTAGSFFKNPIVTTEHYEKLLKKYPDLKGNEISNSALCTLHSALFKLSAGQLIDLIGYKGQTRGPVGTYGNHALVLINQGGATGQDILNFAKEIQKKVLEQFDVVLEPEVMIV
ncbi:MAG: UDP-N-acetylmuramate dehydrogenase [Candidatus Absconditabacterales bacterium]